MEELRQQIVGYLIAAWRKRWWGVLVAWGVCLGGWTLVAMLPDQYEAEAKVYVDTESMLGPLLRDLTVSPNVDQQIAVMLRTLVTRPVLERVARTTDLDLTITTERERDAVLSRLGQKISVSSRGAKNLFGISYTDRDPEMAQRIVSALLAIFVESNVGSSRRETQSAQTLLDSLIAAHEKRLQEAEQRLAAFKQENLDLLPQGGENFGALRNQAQQQRHQLERDLEAARIRRDNLRRQLASTSPLIEVQAAPQVVIGGGGVTLPANLAALAARIQEQQKGLDQLLLRYTEQHPDVVATRRQLAMLQEQYDKEAKASGKEGGSEAGSGGGGGVRANRATVPNALYEQLRLKLVESESEVATLERRLEDATRDLERSNAMAQRAPLAEATLASLDRDYNIVKKNYESLLARRESARISQAADDKADRVQFRIIDPPRTPVTPVGPPRPLYMSGVLAAGIGAGVLFALVLSQLSGTFSSTRRLKQAFGLPVLGSVSQLVTARDRRRQVVGLVGFGFTCTALLIIYSGILAVAPRISALMAAWA